MFYCCKSFLGPPLSDIETYFETAAEFADLHISHAIESPVKEAVDEVNVTDHPAETSNTNEGVYLLTVIHSGNLNLVI